MTYLENPDPRPTPDPDAISELLRPPKWRLLAYWRWLRTQQPRHVEVALWAAFRGEYEPLSALGVDVSARRLGEGPWLTIKHHSGRRVGLRYPFTPGSDK